MRDPFWLGRDEVREFDRRAIEEFGMPSLVLMENAGRGAAEVFLEMNPNHEHVTILCGRGNNGGDGFVIARHLQIRGVSVETILFPNLETELSPDCRMNFEIAKRAGIIIRDGSDPNQNRVRTSYWVIDALFGTGLDRGLTGPIAESIERLNSEKHGVLAIDLPSGLDCDSGEPLGPVVRADVTATFVALKKGFLNPNSRAWTGEIRVVDIGAPKKLLDEFHSLPNG